MAWAPKPHVHPPIQRLALGSPSWPRREGINLPPCDDTTCAWTWQFELGNIWCTNKLHTIEMLQDITPLLRYAQSFLRGQRVANHYGKGQRARGRATTWPCEKTKRARGEDSLSLGTHDALTSYSLPKLAQDGFSYHRPQISWGIYTCLHWRQSRTPGSLTLVSVTTKHTSLRWACNRHSPMVELPNATGQTGKTEPGDLFHLRQGYFLTTVEWKELLPGSSLSHLDHWSRNNDLSLVSGICIVAITISMVLLPCAVSSTWTWVNQLLTLVQWLGWCRTTTYF